MTDEFESIRLEIAHHHSNKELLDLSYHPLFAAGEKARIVVIGQAPGVKAQTSGLAWDDASGQRLMQWMGIDEETFRDVEQIAHIPMDFYYPGKGKSGDLPPRKDFALLWHQKLLNLMPDVRLILLVGQYAQKYYLGRSARANLTQTVHNYHEYLPCYFPIVHPSPLNFRWLNNNPWFESALLLALKEQVSLALE